MEVADVTAALWQTVDARDWNGDYPEWLQKLTVACRAAGVAHALSSCAGV